MIEKAFRLLYPEKSFIYTTSLSYNRKFGDFNANVRKVGRHIEISASKKWEAIGEEIQIGLIQSLLMKLFKEKKDTLHTQLYANFIRNVADYTPKTNVDAVLAGFFGELAHYFPDMEMPNLQWGKPSTRQLGLYDYHNDTVTISSIFKEHSDIAKYILYHELLHKQEKFTHKNGRSHHHTKRFKELEQQYPHAKELEKNMDAILKRKRWKLW